MMNTDWWEDYQLLPTGTKVLCAVSGGADSMCLLHLLKTRETELGIRVYAGHYEHGLRGEEALRDCAFVEDWCRENGVPCTVEHGDVKAWAAQRGLGIEEAARQLRYDFLSRAADKLGCERIATAHTADDNAETLLLNLVRGSGAKGLGGIPPIRGKIIRPLLYVTRVEIEAYLKAEAVDHVEDSSNRQDEYRRNRVRHQVVPLLRELNPAFSAAAGRTADLLREDEDCLEQMAREFIGRWEESGSIPLAAFSKLHPAVASRVLRALCPKSLNYEHVLSARSFAGGEGLAYLDLPGIRLRREQGRLFFGAEPVGSILPRLLRPGTVTPLPEAGLRVYLDEINCAQEEINSQFKTYWLKCEKIHGDIHVTSRQAGDRFRPAGRGVTKSLKSLFLEAGMTQTQRDLTPVFRDDRGIVAVHGFAVDERCAARAGDRCFRLMIEKA